MRVITQLVIVLLFAGIGAGAWYWNEQRAGEAAEGNRQFRGSGRPVGVEVAKPRIDTVAVTVEAVGTALANEAVIITPKVSGIIGKITFKEGGAGQQGGRSRRIGRNRVECQPGRATRRPATSAAPLRSCPGAVQQ